MSSKPSHDDDHLDFGKVEKEAKTMFSYDERYWLENDAKFRAVEQRVATYDEFREIVMAAHLKPLEKEDKISSMGTFTQVWNQSALRNNTKVGGDTMQDVNPEIKTGQTTIKVPQSGQEFLQRWKRECKTLEQKRQFLLAVGAPKVRELFRTEISGGLLGEFPECLLHDFHNSEAVVVTDLLESLSTSQRFSLSLAFLSKKEKENLLALFEKLCSIQTSEDFAGLKERVEAVKTVYSV